MDRRVPWALQQHPELEDLVTAYLVAKSVGQPPWALGHDVPRRRFYETCEILAQAVELATLWAQVAPGHGCPLMGTQ